MRQTACVITCVLGLLVLGGGSARGQSEESSKKQGQSRVLGKHAFIRSELVEWPFITTQVGFSVGAGMYQIPAQGIDESGNTATGKITLGALRQGINLGIGLFDWVALRGSFSGVATAGTNVSDILGFGALFNYDVTGGLFVRVIKTKRFIIGVGGNGSFKQGTLVTPGRALAAAISALNLDAAKKQLTTDTETVAFEPLIALGVAPASFLGLQASFKFDVGKYTVGAVSETEKALIGGVSATFDMQGLYIPLAIPLAYQLNHALRDQSETTHLIEAGLFYSGRTNLDLGLSVRTEVGSADSRQLFGLLRLNYIW